MLSSQLCSRMSGALARRKAGPVIGSQRCHTSNAIVRGGGGGGGGGSVLKGTFRHRQHHSHHHAVSPAYSSSRGYSSSRATLRNGNSNNSNIKDLPPLPPSSTTTTSSSSKATASSLSPAKAKQEFLKTSQKTEDPLQQMARLQKELDIVRDRAAERLEQRLQKSVWRRLTDPLRRHSHSWINVGAVLLAYILAHNLYMTGREKKQVQEQLDETTVLKDTYLAVLREMLTEETLQQVAAACVEELHQKGNNGPSSSSSSSSAGSWFGSKNASRNKDKDEELLEAIQATLEKELRKRIGDHTLTDEERRIKAMQQAWEESQQAVIVESTEASPEMELVQAVLMGDDAAMEKAAATTAAGGESSSSASSTTGTATKKQRRVISM